MVCRRPTDDTKPPSARAVTTRSSSSHHYAAISCSMDGATTERDNNMWHPDQRTVWGQRALFQQHQQEQEHSQHDNEQ